MVFSRCIFLATLTYSLTFIGSVGCVNCFSTFLAYGCPPDQNNIFSLEMPNFAVKEACGDADFCMKRYEFKRKQVIQGYSIYGTRLTWGCLKRAEVSTMPPGINCTTRLESSTIALNNETGEINFEYRRDCTCCGDGCNGRAMDGVCDKEPKFTQTCYSAHKTYLLNSAPVKNGSAFLLPEDALETSCTAEQTCMKTVTIVGANVDFSWGCVTLPKTAVSPCKFSKFEKTKVQTIKMCGCCGDLCNGRALDFLGTSSTRCTK